MWFLQSLFLSFLLFLLFPSAGIVPVYAPLSVSQAEKLAPAKCECNLQAGTEGDKFYEPRRLRIAKISLDSPVFPVGVDSDGYLATPKDDQSVGWFYEGIRVGESGNLVLVGHFDLPGSKPGVFARLRELTVGDTVIVDSTVAYEYVVTSVAWVYENDDRRLEKVFTESTTPIITLVTCGGQWQSGKGTYDRRLLVRGVIKD